MKLKRIINLAIWIASIYLNCIELVNGAVRNKKITTVDGSSMKGSFASSGTDIVLKRDKKTLVSTKLKKHSDTETLKEWIKEVDSSGLLRKILKRKIYIPEDSSLSLSSQVSRPNIFPNIFNQGEGFIVDAVIEWPIWLNLYLLSEAVNGKREVPKDDPDAKSELEDEDYISEGKSMPSGPGFIGVERCLIYEKLETGMSMYLDIPRNQSHDCILRAVCEAQQVADHYHYAPTSIFFEVIHLILKPSLSHARQESCYQDYLVAEEAAYKAPGYCSSFVSKCPLNIAGLFVRNFFPEILL